MSYEMLTSPVELTDAELDMIAGGLPPVAQEGLVNANVQVEDVCVPVNVQVLAENNPITFDCPD